MHTAPDFECCGRSFVNAGAYQSHRKSKLAEEHEATFFSHAPKLCRKRYTAIFKFGVVVQVMANLSLNAPLEAQARARVAVAEAHARCGRMFGWQMG